MSNINSLLDFKQDGLRPGQHQALRVLFERILAGEKYTSIVLPTRYGKSDVIRVAAFQLKKLDLVHLSIILNPNLFLKQQIANTKDCDVTKQRYGINKKTSVYTPDNPSVYSFGRENEDIISITMQWATMPHNNDNLCKWTESVIHRYKRPPIVFVDECHTGSESNRWGESVKNLVDAGAFCVLLTATAYRSDNERIVGFNYETVRINESIIKKHVGNLDAQYKLVDILSVQDCTLRLVPDHETSFKDAWNERPSPLCRIDRKTFSVNLEKFINGISTEETSTLRNLDSYNLVKRALGKAVRDKVTIYDGCKRFIDALLNFRKNMPGALGIVFCSNDIEGSVNKHPKQIKRIINKLDKTLQCTILTSNTDEDELSDDAANELRLFADGLNGDILIVKQMAGLGLNAPKLKVGLDLSPTRTLAAYVQRLMRIATPCDTADGRQELSVWICPDDVIADSLWKCCVESQGGDASTRQTELIKTIIEKRKENTKNDITGEWLPVGTEHGPIMDNSGNMSDPQGWDEIKMILDRFPFMSKYMTQSEILASFKDMGIAFNAPQTEDLNQVKNSLIAEIQNTFETITGMRLRANGLASNQFQSIIKKVYIEVCLKAGVSPKPDPGSKRAMDGHSVAELKQIKLLSERMRHEEKANHAGDHIYSRAGDTASCRI